MLRLKPTLARRPSCIFLLLYFFSSFLRKVFHLHDPKPAGKLFAKDVARGVRPGKNKGTDFRGYDFPEGAFPTSGREVGRGPNEWSEPGPSVSAFLLTARPPCIGTDNTSTLEERGFFPKAPGGDGEALVHAWSCHRRVIRGRFLLSPTPSKRLRWFSLLLSDIWTLTGAYSLPGTSGDRGTFRSCLLPSEGREN